MIGYVQDCNSIMCGGVGAEARLELTSGSAGVEVELTSDFDVNRQRKGDVGLYKMEVLGTVSNCVTVERARKTEREHTLKMWIGNGTGYLGYQRTPKGFSDL